MSINSKKKLEGMITNKWSWGFDFHTEHVLQESKLNTNIRWCYNNYEAVR